MFDLCKKVNVYNIENHYYVHEVRQTPNHLKQRIRYDQLQAKPISVTSSTLHRHRGSLQYQKKGLQLSSQIFSRKSDSKPKQNEEQYLLNLNQLTSLKSKNLSQKYQHEKLISTKQSYTSKINVRQPYLYENIQIIHSKHQNLNIKPASVKHSSHHNIHVKNKPIQLSMMKTLQTIPAGSKRLVETSCSALGNHHLESQGKNDRIGIHNLQTSRNLNPRKDSQISFILHKSSHSFSSKNSQNNGSQYENSLNLSSYSKNFEPNLQNRNIPLKPSYLEIENSIQKSQRLSPTKLNAPANSASVILSQILSRDSSHIQINNFGKKSKLFKDIDRLTIKSYEADFSQFSLHVQESILCQHNPQNNFIQIKKQQRQNYTLATSLQKTTGCIVTLKQLDFLHMNKIAGELQIYNLLENQKINIECSRSIQALLQVQVTASSYLLIKQPFQKSLLDLFRQLIAQKVHKKIKKLKQQLFKIVKIIFNQFESLKIQLKQKLRISDFVTSLQVIKLENMSAFKTISESTIIKNQSLEQIIASLEQQIQNLQEASTL